MSTKLVTWNDDKTRLEIQKRLRNASEARMQQEDYWLQNEASVYRTTQGALDYSALSSSLGVTFTPEMTPGGSGDVEHNTSYTFKNFRYIHAQLSSNPPSVVMRPQTSDQEDHRKADAADRIVRYAIRHYKMQERVDQMSLQTLLYGTGVMKTVWDSGLGAILDYDEKTEEMQLEGDIAVSVPFIWNIFVDPDAKTPEEIKWVLERIYLDYDEACGRWPGKEEILRKAKVEKASSLGSGNSGRSGRDSGLRDDRYNSVELYEYWETGLPTNGYMGRYCITTRDGEVVESTRSSPQRFRKAGAVSRVEQSDLPEDVKEAQISRIREQAALPYHFFTDIDVPNGIWGRSMIEYAAQLQNNLNRMDSARLDNLETHAVLRLIIPESADISDDGITNSPRDVIKISGNQPPYFMDPPQILPDLTPARVDTIQGINDVMGVNESMFGQQSREQAAAAMQYATNQGNMIRRRLFNKYVLVTESVYNSILNLFRKHWTTKRIIGVLGKEKALESIDVKGTDIDGGYDVVGEYGATLSLDPITRRQEVMTLQPLFEKAGVPPRTALRMMKLSELEGMYDKLDLAGNRQKEIFDLMIATGGYIPPKKFRDHENMIAWAYDYFMTSEFEMLSEDLQLLCEQHIQDRVQLAAQEKTGLAGVPAGAPATPAAPPAPAVPAPEAPPLPPT